MRIDVTLNTDNNYVQHCMAMLCSLFENNRNHDIYIHILSNNLSQINVNFIKTLSSKYNNHSIFYEVDESLLEGVQFRNNRPLTKAAYYRLLLSSIIDSKIQKVLYLDCDMIVLGDVSELFELNLDNYALAASIDNFPYTYQHRLQLNMDINDRTFCSGMMLVNLDYWRKNNSESKLLSYAKKYRKEVHLHDQDVLNYVFKGVWFQIPPKWNRTAFSRRHVKMETLKSFDYYEYTYEPKIIHYASVGIKPWYDGPSPKKKVYSKYLIKSGYTPIIYENKGVKYKFKGICAVCSMWVAMYIWPYIPNLLKLIIKDIYFIYKVLTIILFKKCNGLNRYLLMNSYDN